MVILSFAGCKLEKTVNESCNRPFEDSKTSAQVDALYERMTMDERIMQLCGIRPNQLLGDDGKLSLEKCRERIPNGIGHLCQFSLRMDEYKKNKI
jgi:beta-glucosidase